MELTRERLIGIISSAIVIIVLGLYVFLYRPIIYKCAEAGAECRGIEREILRGREAIGLLGKDNIKRVLISEKDISVAIDELTKEARSKGINFVSITPGKIESPSDSRYKIFPIDIEMESAYKELAEFLGLVEQLKKGLVTVRYLDIVSDSERSAWLNTRLIVNMYLLNK